MALEGKSVDDMIASLAGVDDELAGMLRAGVTIEQRTGDPQHVLLVTTDTDVARKYDMHEESEFLGLDAFDTIQTEDDANDR